MTMAKTLSVGTKLLRAPRSRSPAGQKRRHWLKNCLYGHQATVTTQPISCRTEAKLSVGRGGPERMRQFLSVRHIEIVSKSTVEKLARDGVKRIRAFPDS